MKDFSNIGAKSLGQNGYRKYDDGLLIQWGYITGSASIKTTYLNSSFYDSNYNVSAIGVYNNTSEAVVIAPKLNHIFECVLDLELIMVVADILPGLTIGLLLAVGNKITSNDQ